MACQASIALTGVLISSAGGGAGKLVAGTESAATSSNGVRVGSNGVRVNFPNFALTLNFLTFAQNPIFRTKA